MRFQLANDVIDLGAYLPRFLVLTGEDQWKRRAVQLCMDHLRSPYQAKIVTDYHWLEMELSNLMLYLEHNGALPDRVEVASLAALHFAGMVIEVHQRLSPAGRAALKGRLRDGLNSGFSSLYLEIEMALLLIDEGFDIEFPDLEGTGQADLFFANGPIEGEVECKSQSADAGRKIHRKDFYRFVDKIGPAILSRAQSTARDILIVTVTGRFPRDTQRQHEVADAAEGVLSDSGSQPVKSNWYKIELQPIDAFDLPSCADTHELHSACRRALGQDCHVAGLATESGVCLVVVRSEQQDDTSKPLLESLKKAQSQLSGTRSGFIAVQLNDIASRDLTLPHLRRRMSILANALFHKRETQLLAAVYFCAYAGLHYSDNGAGIPAFVCWNPRFANSTEGMPLRGGFSNSEFAKLLSVDPAETDPDDHVYGMDI